LPVIRKPNSWQTRIQFINQWVVSKLLYGNTYVLKERDNRRVVTALYILDPRLVTALVADDGSVFYDIRQDKLSGVSEQITVPGTEIIHDRGICPFHPLVGVSPIYACGLSTTQGLKIQRQSATFFENASAPSGQLTAPGNIDDITAERIKREFEKKFSGGGMGRVFVSGSGLTYQPMTMPASDAQLIEQLKFTVEDVARCFKVPIYKLGGPLPTFNNATAMNQDYYTQCLQAPIEAIELLYDEGLSLPVGRGTEMDIDVLLRMDPLSRIEADAKAVGAGILAPNEARRNGNYPPVTGGNTPYLQQQNYSLAALNKRDTGDDPFSNNKPPALPAPDNPPPAPSAPEADSGAKVIDIPVRRQEFALLLRAA
jgi:HK97 family phage portal protein